MEFRLPELGEGVYEAELVSWLVQPGQSVKRGQPLMEVLTDKATMEVPSPFAGTIAALQAESGQVLKVGQVVLSYSAAGETANAPVKEPVAAAVAVAPAKPAAHVDRKNGNSSTTLRAGLTAKAAPSVRYLARKLGIDLRNARRPHQAPGPAPQDR